ncbi:MAG: peptidoglycan bridge formation glycyltransferase FemA/FemB family protein [Rhizobiaceae bacterium]|nr:peptidoglycan bridge formation glycyltransferase FemA/FemB family protein [Rhizobiaceae bacterium]
MTISYFDIGSRSFASERRDTKAKVQVNENRSPSKIELKFVDAAAWDEIASGFSDIIPEQMGCFNTGHWGRENTEFPIFLSNGLPIGGAAMIVKKIPFTKSGIAILKWGPVFHKHGQKFNGALYSDILECLKQEYCVRRNFHLTVMPVANPNSSDQCESILTELGFAVGGGLPSPERYLVNVQESPETLMTKLDQKWRYNLRKSLKNEFEIEVDDTESGLMEFLKLYEKMMARKQFFDSSAIGSLEEFVTSSPSGAKPKIVLVRHDGRITAGGVFHVTGNVASYMFGATDDRALKLKAGYALHWWMAEYLISRGEIDWYDLGGNDNDTGLHQFKKGFVGKSGIIQIAAPRYHFARSLTAKMIGFAAFEARNALAIVKQAMHRIRSKA